MSECEHPAWMPPSKAEPFWKCMFCGRETKFHPQKAFEDAERLEAELAATKGGIDCERWGHCCRTTNAETGEEVCSHCGTVTLEVRAPDNLCPGCYAKIGQEHGDHCPYRDLGDRLVRESTAPDRRVTVARNGEGEYVASYDPPLESADDVTITASVSEKRGE